MAAPYGANSDKTNNVPILTFDFLIFVRLHKVTWIVDVPLGVSDVEGEFLGGAPLALPRRLGCFLQGSQLLLPLTAPQHTQLLLRLT